MTGGKSEAECQLKVSHSLETRGGGWNEDWDWNYHALLLEDNDGDENKSYTVMVMMMTVSMTVMAMMMTGTMKVMGMKMIVMEKKRRWRRLPHCASGMLARHGGEWGSGDIHGFLIIIITFLIIIILSIITILFIFLQDQHPSPHHYHAEHPNAYNLRQNLHWFSEMKTWDPKTLTRLQTNQFLPR